MIKNVYFVRHGESLGNAEGKRQGSGGGLSERGLRQALFVAKRFELIPVDTILSSTYQRALETAAIISKHIDVPVAISDLIHEVRRPAVIVGKGMYDPDVIEVFQQMYDNYHDPKWRYSDEENFADVKARALSVLNVLETMPEENILVVTHGNFIRALLGAMMFGGSLEPDVYLRILQMFPTNNTSITMAEWSDAPSDYERATGWRVLAWNDHAHLGEVRE